MGERERVDRVGKILRACKRLEGFMREAKREREETGSVALCAPFEKTIPPCLPVCDCAVQIYTNIEYCHW